jgi:hypothetical protein
MVLGTLTAGGLVLYFSLAAGAHLRVRDIGRNLLSATALLGFSAYVVTTFI